MGEEKIALLEIINQAGKESGMRRGQKIKFTNESVAVEGTQPTVFEPHRGIHFLVNHRLEHLFMVAPDRDDPGDFLQGKDDLNDLPRVGAAVNEVSQKDECIGGVG